MEKPSTVKFIEKQRGEEGKKSIKECLDKIEEESLKNRALNFEWVVLRLIYMLNLTNEKPQEIYNGKLDEKFQPLKIAPSSEPDLEITFYDKKIAVEATLRPVSGYIEHFSHLKNKDLGLFFFLKKYTELLPEVWETFLNNYKRYDDLFLPISCREILKFAEVENPKEKFYNFINQSKKHFETADNWEKLKMKFV